MTEAAGSLIRGFAKKSRGIGRSVMIEHTLFSFPFAISAFLLESAGQPPLQKVAWILVALFGARNGANALNRLIDAEIDAANPRTAGRDLPAGRVRRFDLWLFTLLCGLMLLVAAWQLNTLCLALVPVAGGMILLYSYTKRFTWLCHYWLGITCAAATMGSFLALSGRFELRYFPLTAAVALWVAGFDIIYALQDIEHDRRHGLHSIPAQFGRKGALVFVALSYTGSTLMLLLNGYIYEIGAWYYIGVVLVTLILAAEILIAWRGTVQWIPFASYRLNQILSPLFLLFTLLALYFSGGNCGGGFYG